MIDDRISRITITCTVGVKIMGQGDEVLASTIREHGWAVVRIESAMNAPGYAYTVGLYKTFGHPEIIVFGLDMNVMQEILNTIGRRVRTGERYVPTDADDRVLQGHHCAFRLVADAAELAYMGILIGYYQHSVPVLHCIWPDQTGRFPWEPGASARFRRDQPMLSEGPEPSTDRIPDDQAGPSVGGENGI